MIVMSSFKIIQPFCLMFLLNIVKVQSLAFAFSLNCATKPSFLSVVSNHRRVTSLPLLSSGGVNGDDKSMGEAFSPVPELGASADRLLNTTTALSPNASDADELMALTESPQLSFEKYMTMQDKRVVVTIRYSGDAGLKAYFLTIVKKLKASHPDVMIERRILADVEVDDDEATFEVLVDGRNVLGRGKKQKAVDMSKSRSVFVSMHELDLAISRARRRRRPSTAYGAGTHPGKSSDVATAE